MLPWPARDFFVGFFFIIIITFYLRSAATQMGSKLPHAAKNLNLKFRDTEAQYYAGNSPNHMMATGKSFHSQVLYFES